MPSGLPKKYNLFTAISMVVGIVIGSGVFFKAEKVLSVTGGDIKLGLLSWALGGLIMLICTYTFSILAGRYEYVSGLVDYAETALGKNYAYYVGWFMSLIYYPSLAATLAWVSARYTCLLLGFSSGGGEALTLTAFFLIAAFSVNTLAPVIAGKVQITSTVIKLIPLVLMGIVGTVAGLKNGILAENLSGGTIAAHGVTVSFPAALAATAFAYDGWIVATSINAELCDAKRNLPKALLTGSFVVIVAYLLYYTGLSGALPKVYFIENGETAIRFAFEALFSSVGGVLLIVFVIISCLGTLNGIMLGCTRSLYSLAIRKEGPRPFLFSQVDGATGIPANAGIWGLFIAVCWLVYFYGASFGKWFGDFGFDITELPAITMYALYIPIFCGMMAKEKQLDGFRRFLMPMFATISCLFILITACYAHRGEIFAYYLVVFLLMIPAYFFNKKNRSV
ncbi:MAG: APC family permease [Clostridia bacterium]|nr:APC family permease [Clostridia bacterium]